MTAPVATQQYAPLMTISRLEESIMQLNPAQKEVFRRIFRVQTTQSPQKIPDEMRAWVERQFGSVEDVESQTIVRVDNLVTLEAALFNELRAKRPIESPELPNHVKEQIENTENCAFCNPLGMTGYDSLVGRVKGLESVTAANVARYDTYHDLIIPKKHNPLQFTLTGVRDYLEVALKWFKSVNSKDTTAACPFLMWNVLWRAGGSIMHNHMQMTLSTGGHYPGVERLKRASDSYSDDGRNGRDYFEDLFKAHETVGLGIRRNGTHMMAELTPKKEKGVMLVAKMEDWEKFPTLALPIHYVITKYLGMGSQSFNVGFYMPSLPRDNGWHRFPVVVRFVERGPLKSNMSDIGGMEMFGEIPVISTDPYKLMEQLKPLPFSTNGNHQSQA